MGHVAWIANGHPQVAHALDIEPKLPKPALRGSLKLALEHQHGPPRTSPSRVHDALRRSAAAGPRRNPGAGFTRSRASHATTSDLVRSSNPAGRPGHNSSATRTPPPTRAVAHARSAEDLIGGARWCGSRSAGDLPLPRALSGGAHLSRGQLHVHAVSVAAYSANDRRLRGSHADTAHLAGPLRRRRQAADAGRVGVQPLEEIAAMAPPLRARGTERKRLGLDHAAGRELPGRPVRARRRRQPRDRLPPRRPTDWRSRPTAPLRDRGRSMAFE